MKPPVVPAETVYDGKFLRMKKAGKWEYVSRTNATGVVVILPLTNDHKIVVIGEYRAAVGKKVIGLPAGLVGDEEKFASEERLVAAQRELWEETGYVSQSWERLAEGPSSPGLTDELITFFVAKNAVPSEKAPPPSEEEIEVHVIPLQELSGWLRRKEAEGCLVDYKIFAALYLSQNSGK
jgi:ADP-ribose pyrophosphatase